MRILYLSPCRPMGTTVSAAVKTSQDGRARRGVPQTRAARHGAEVRASQVARALEIGNLDFVAVTMDDDDQTSGNEGNDTLPVQRVIKLKHGGPRSVWSRLRCGFDPKFTGYYGFYVERQDQLSVLSDLAKYNLVWIYGMRTADVMGQWHWPRTVMDIDDVPSTFLQTEREYSQGFIQRLRPISGCASPGSASSFCGNGFRVL